MSPDRRGFLKALGGAGTVSLAALAAQGVQSQSGSISAGPVRDVAWDDPTKLAADDGNGLDYFGSVAALSDDGRTALIGAYGDEDPERSSGSAYVFTWDGSGWEQQSKLVPEDNDSSDYFGDDVALSADGDTALVTAENDDDPNGVSQGSAYVFTRSGETWTEQAKLVADDAAGADHFGQSGALTADGSTALIGSPGDENENGVSAGSAYVFTESDGSWSQEQKLLASDGEASRELGHAVAITDDGSYAFVSMEGYQRSDDGSGAVFVYERSGGSYSEGPRLTPNNSDQNRRFGQVVEVSGDGTTVVVGAPGPPRFPDAEITGAAYIYSGSNGSWSQQAQLTLDGDGNLGFGAAVAASTDGSTVLVGAPLDSDPNGNQAGSASVYAPSDGSWTQQRKLSAPDGDTFDTFGTGVSLSARGNAALVGARGDEDPNGDRAGSAYVSGTVPEEPTTPSTPTPGSDQMSGETTSPPDTEESGTESPGGSGPGFGVLSAAASLATAGYLLRNRGQDGEHSE